MIGNHHIRLPLAEKIDSSSYVDCLEMFDCDASSLLASFQYSVDQPVDLHAKRRTVTGAMRQEWWLKHETRRRPVVVQKQLHVSHRWAKAPSITAENDALAPISHCIVVWCK